MKTLELKNIIREVLEEQSLKAGRELLENTKKLLKESGEISDTEFSQEEKQKLLNEILKNTSPIDSKDLLKEVSSSK